MSAAPEDLRIIRRRELAALLGVSPMTIHRWQARGDFPPKIRSGPNVVGWRFSVFVYREMDRQ